MIAPFNDKPRPRRGPRRSAPHLLLQIRRHHPLRLGREPASSSWSHATLGDASRLRCSTPMSLRRRVRAHILGDVPRKGGNWHQHPQENELPRVPIERSSGIGFVSFAGLVRERLLSWQAIRNTAATELRARMPAHGPVEAAPSPRFPAAPSARGRASYPDLFPEGKVLDNLTFKGCDTDRFSGRAEIAILRI
jgi:hypothetical protein